MSGRLRHTLAQGLVSLGLVKQKSLAEQYPQHRIGRHTYGWPDVIDFGDTPLEIGAFCSISREVTILLGGEHRIDWLTTYPFPGLWDAARGIDGHPSTRGPVVIGNDVWIGYRGTCLSGTRIANRAVIGAGSVVAGDIPPYAVAAGNPCRVISRRFPSEIVARLERVAWWSWPDDDIAAALPLLLSSDPEPFLVFAEAKAS